MQLKAGTAVLTREDVEETLRHEQEKASSALDVAYAEIARISARECELQGRFEIAERIVRTMTAAACNSSVRVLAHSA